MILYHVTTNLFHNGSFTPRVPENRRPEENDDILRVCVSSSIEGCLTAMPEGGSGLDDTLYDNCGLLLVFEFDTDVIPLNIKSPEELYFEDLVDDALISNEYWILESATATNSYIINVDYFNDEDNEYVVESTLYKEAKNLDIEPADLHNDKHGFYPSTTTVIQCLEYSFLNESVLGEPNYGFTNEENNFDVVFRYLASNVFNKEFKIVFQSENKDIDKTIMQQLLLNGVITIPKHLERW